MKRLLPAIALFAVAAALVVVGTLLLVHPRVKDASGNVAVVDRTATAQVVSQVSTGLNQVLSYDYTNPAPNTAAAAKWLTGDAVGQYKLLFTQLRQRAPGQQLSFVSKVSAAGVQTLEHGTAQLLVFVDQKSTRASDNASSVAAAQVLITAVQKDGLWRISELKVL